MRSGLTVLVTGASGFMGTALVRRLVAEGFKVRGTHRRASPPSVAGVDWQLLTQLDSIDTLNQLTLGCDVVIHLAALVHQHGPAALGRWQEFSNVNAEGTRRLAHACREAGVRRFIFLSSVAAVCSQSEVWVDEQTPCRPKSDYGRSKLEAEQATREQLLNGATDWCVLRPPLLYGPGNPGNMFRLMSLLAKGWPLPLGSIRNRRSFMYIENLVDALLAVVRYPASIRSTFMLTDGSDFATPELVSALATAKGRSVRLLRVPVPVLRLAGHLGDAADKLLRTATGIDSYSVDRLIGSLPVNGSRFRHFFDWQPPISSGEALKMTVGSSVGD